ncbi:MAG: branched-chain amino acid ABC transporter permease [Proteobacteria bacterium]|nr:branched-chain amino acid ABC transporter permease [Pseudomonadota bacterium]
MLVEILVYGAVASAVYAMLAVGLTLMVGIARVMNLAHGTFYMLGAYGVFTAGVALGLPLALGFALALAAAGVVAVLIKEICLKPLAGNMDSMLVMTLILALLFEEIILLVFGPAPRSIPPFISGRVLIAGISVPSQRLLVVAVSLVTISGLWFFIARTRIGGAILAVAQDPEAAALMGVNSRRITLLIHVLAAFLAASAGILVSPFLSASPTMWLWPLVKAFTIVILGGLGSIGGSILAACILGFSETIVAFAVSPRLTELVALAILFLVIVLRPSGLLGQRTGN